MLTKTNNLIKHIQNILKTSNKQQEPKKTTLTKTTTKHTQSNKTNKHIQHKQKTANKHKQTNHTKIKSRTNKLKQAINHHKPNTYIKQQNCKQTKQGTTTQQN